MVRKFKGDGGTNKKGKRTHRGPKSKTRDRKRTRRENNRVQKREGWLYRMIPFFQKDKRRIDKELVNVPVQCLFTKLEKEWITAQAKEECTSANSIIRKSVKLYKKAITTTIEPKED